MKQNRIKGKFIMTPIASLKALSPSQYMVYSALSYRADNTTGECYPSWARIMDDTGMSRSTVYRHIEELSDSGWVVKISRGSNRSNRANRYKVLESPRDHSVRNDTIDNDHSVRNDTMHSVRNETMHSVRNDTLTKPSTKPITKPDLEVPKGTQDLPSYVDFDIDFNSGDSKGNQDTYEGFDTDVVIANDDLGLRDLEPLTDYDDL